MPRIIAPVVAFALLAATWNLPSPAQEAGADANAAAMEGMGGMDGCPMMGAHGGVHRGMGAGMGEGMGGDTGQMLEKRLAKLKADLTITDAQAKPWAAYEKAMLARRETMRANRENMMKSGLAGTPVTRLDTHIEAMQKMLDSLKSLKPATETLYGALDEPQKNSADKLMGVGGCKL